MNHRISIKFAHKVGSSLPNWCPKFRLCKEIIFLKIYVSVAPVRRSAARRWSKTDSVSWRISIRWQVSSSLKDYTESAVAVTLKLIWKRSHFTVVATAEGHWPCHSMQINFVSFSFSPTFTWPRGVIKTSPGEHQVHGKSPISFSIWRRIVD